MLAFRKQNGYSRLIGHLHDGVTFDYNYQNALGIVSLIPDSKTIGTKYITKENRQSILVVIVNDAIMQVSYC
jgi:hypothetical protein